MFERTVMYHFSNKYKWDLVLPKNVFIYLFFNNEDMVDKRAVHVVPEFNISVRNKVEVVVVVLVRCNNF